MIGWHRTILISDWSIVREMEEETETTEDNNLRDWELEDKETSETTTTAAEDATTTTITTTGEKNVMI